MIVEFEGVELVCEKIEVEFLYDDRTKMDSRINFSNLKPGDTYIGKRNKGWQMGTVSEKLWAQSIELGCIYGQEMIYPYDAHECLKVLSIKE